jgi:dihydropteroate synthase
VKPSSAPPSANAVFSKSAGKPADQHAGDAAGAFQCGRYRFTLDRPLVMGILNITPDSFSDGGRFLARDAALRQAEQMLREQVDLIDIGGESSRPGATALPLEQELDRVIPLIEALRDCGVPLSVDTYKPAVMHAALAAGADMINDIWGFRQPGAVQAVAAANCGLCVMHMAGDPRSMQEQPQYNDVVAEVRDFLAQRMAQLQQAGVARARISVDPGFGFGKSVAHNYALLARLRDLAPADVPLLAGISRKSMLGAVTGRTVAAERVAASVAAAVCAAERGAKLLRVHDVAATVDALKVWQAVRTALGSK